MLKISQMEQRCHICVDPICNGLQNCKCGTCDKKNKCYRRLKPTIRITRKCTQSCGHCCFECSPNETEMMSVDMANDINTFCRNNGIENIEVMGGEFYLNPDWEPILEALVYDMETVRLVTNGDWAASNVSFNVILFLTNHPQVYVGVSKDRWHNNKNVDKAKELLNTANIRHRVSTEMTDESIVPIGNSEFDCGLYSMMACYCRNPEKRYSFLIDEIGEIYKCGFGVWPYANVKEYIDGDFSKRFKEFNTVFYGAWISSCRSCVQAEQRKARKDL